MLALPPVNWSTLAAPVLGVIGLALGAWLQSRREHRVWLRNQRYETYTSYLNAMLEIDTLFRHQLQLALQEREEKQISHAFNEALTTLSTLMHAIQRIRLIGPHGVVKAAENGLVQVVAGLVKGFIEQMKSPAFDDQAWTKLLMSINSATVDSLLEMGKDVGVSRRDRHIKARMFSWSETEQDQLLSGLEEIRKGLQPIIASIFPPTPPSDSPQ
jgi:hypothetical protein